MVDLGEVEVNELRQECSNAKNFYDGDIFRNLGILHRNQGKMKEAEDMYLRALAGLVVGKIWDGMRPLTPIPL